MSQNSQNPEMHALSLQETLRTKRHQKSEQEPPPTARSPGLNTANGSPFLNSTLRETLLVQTWGGVRHTKAEHIASTNLLSFHQHTPFACGADESFHLFWVLLKLGLTEPRPSAPPQVELTNYSQTLSAGDERTFKTSRETFVLLHMVPSFRCCTLPGKKTFPSLRERREEQFILTHRI